MPEDITNLVTYINSMSVTLYDKCWWIDKIPEDIDTVVDFGCAGGDLYFMINCIMPNRFKYVGVDNSPLMIDLFKHNFELFSCDCPIFDSLPEAIKHVNPAKSVLVLNSVIHEIYSYLSPDGYDQLFKVMFNSGFKYIAIRDMHIFDQYNNQILVNQAEEHIEKIEKHPIYGSKWNEFLEYYTSQHERFLEKSEIKCYAFGEFLLKYWYEANWARESKETYLWPWVNLTYQYGQNYHIDFENNFYIPYIKNKIREDFGFYYSQNTHKKLLLRLR